MLVPRVRVESAVKYTVCAVEYAGALGKAELGKPAWAPLLLSSSSLYYTDTHCATTLLNSDHLYILSSTNSTNSVTLGSSIALGCKCMTNVPQSMSRKTIPYFPISPCTCIIIIRFCSKHMLIPRRSSTVGGAKVGSSCFYQLFDVWYDFQALKIPKKSKYVSPKSGFFPTSPNHTGQSLYICVIMCFERTARTLQNCPI